MKLLLVMALTVDGKIAKESSQLADWTSLEDKKSFIELTKEAGVIIMGNSTYQTIGKPLPGRLNIILTPEANKFNSIPNKLEYSSLSPSELLKDLEQRGYTKAILGGGAYTNKSFWELGLIDELILTIEPVIFGKGLTLFTDNDFETKLKLIETRALNNQTLRLHYQVLK
ncbi:MAG TPA: dihydrofolate reductase family protein [bacterium]|nr:dihydrofolate reductase family protein [bacterium]